MSHGHSSDGSSDASGGTSVSLGATNHPENNNEDTFGNCFLYYDSPEFNYTYYYISNFCDQWIRRYGGIAQCMHDPEKYFFRVRTRDEAVCHPKGLSENGDIFHFYDKTKEYEDKWGIEDAQARKTFKGFKDCFVFRDDYGKWPHKNNLQFCQLWSDEWTGVPGKEIEIHDCIKHHKDFVIPKDSANEDCELKSGIEHRPRNHLYDDSYQHILKLR